MVPAALALSLERHAHRLASGARQAVAALVPLVLLLALVPHFTYRNYTDLVVQTFGYHRLAFDITHDGRTFIYGRHDVAQAVPALLDDVDKYSDPGDRLFVGTGDLRKTPYSDAYLYYLFPHLVPATYYIEMDPGVANAEGSRLADDLASADVVILSTLWDNWDEPNDSLEVGSDAASQVLKDNFCQVGTYGAALYYLYIPCDRLPSSG
jgi:hypothetical protein